MAWIPPGTFVLDAPFVNGRSYEEYGYEVRLTQPFYLMDHEVTLAEWVSVMGSTPEPIGPTCNMHVPVSRVSYDDVASFLKRVSLRDGVTYRLPTEVEWEWAARGGENEPRLVGWFFDNGGFDTSGEYDPGCGSAHPGCLLPRNGYGMCDMSGNVSEWVSDNRLALLPVPSLDPVGPLDGTTHVVRGGSWKDLEEEWAPLGSWASRTGSPSLVIGFRVARSLLPASPEPENLEPFTEDRVSWPPHEITTPVVPVGGRALIGAVTPAAEDEGPHWLGAVVAGDAPDVLLRDGGAIVATFPGYRVVSLIPGTVDGETAVLVGLAWNVEGAWTGAWELFLANQETLRSAGSGYVAACPSLESLEPTRNGGVRARCGGTYDGRDPRKSDVRLRVPGFRTQTRGQTTGADPHRR